MHAHRLGPDADTRCLVVGGCGGIGLAYVEGLIAAEARIAVLDIAAVLERTSFSRDILTQPCDVRDEAGLGKAIAAVGHAWGGIDVLTYVTGITANHDHVADVGLDSVRAVLDVNLVGAVAACKAAWPFLLRSPTGVILLVSSGLSQQGEKGFGAYAASKGGLNALTKVLAKEGGPAIRANAIAPGLVETAFLTGGTAEGHETAGVDRFFDARGDADRSLLKTITLGRVAQPADVAEPMLFLSGSASRFMTGQIIHVNGGRFTP